MGDQLNSQNTTKNVFMEIQYFYLKTDKIL